LYRRSSWRQCSTPFGINEGFTYRVGGEFGELIVCSTPFGINEGFTRSSRRRRGADYVLNAFRHQRRIHIVLAPMIGCVVVCSTPFGINEGFTRPDGANVRPDFVCSTPFGINEGFTLHLGGSTAAALRVLNAFRHQRRIHFGYLDDSNFNYVCSTPFGINEGFTRRIGIDSGKRTCAQRLSASTKDSQ